MHFRYTYLLAAAFLAVLVCPAWAGEDETPDNENSFRKKRQELEKQALDDREKGLKEVEAKVKDMTAKVDEAFKPQQAEIVVDGETIAVKQPTTQEEALGLAPEKRIRDSYEVSPDDMEIVFYDHWTLNASDFRFDTPQYITTDDTLGTARTWFGFTFSITNSTTKPRRIAPVFTAITNRGTRHTAVGGYLPERLLADSTFRPLGGSDALRDAELVKEGVTPIESVADMITKGGELPNTTLKTAYTFEPGQTRWGAALWSEFDNNFSDLKIVVSGLSTAHRYEEKQRRVLVLNFTRNSDGTNVTQTHLNYTGKKWEYAWMWDQEISIPAPTDPKVPQIKAQELQTPAGAKRFVFAFPFEVKNSTKVNQDLSIKTVAFAVPIELDVSGVKVPVTAHFIDDGRSTIYKAQLLKAEGAEAVKDRFQNKTLVDGPKTTVERHMLTLEPGKSTDKVWAAFDENDADYSEIALQVELALNRSEEAKPAVEKEDAKKVAFHATPIRKLTAAERDSIKEQVKKALPEAIEKAKQTKTITAVFDAVSGLSSGKARISRSYRQPGVVDEAWLKAFEDVGK